METVRSGDGTTIAFDRSGEGPTIVLVGGALSDRAAAAPLAALLASRFTVLTYDRRGRGDSGDTAPYGVDREVEDLGALIDRTGGSVFVFGHSSGAALAIEAVRRLAITRLALYEPPFIIDDSRSPVPQGYVGHLNELVASGRRGDAVAFFMTAGVGVPVDVVDEMRSAPMWPAMEAYAHTLAYDGAIMGDHMSGSPLPAEWASAITCPTLVMDGGNSPAWQRNAVAALVDLLPDARRRTFEGEDHGVAPQVVAPVLEEFFAPSI